MELYASAGGPAQLLVHAAGLGDIDLEASHLVVVVDVAPPPSHDGLDLGEVVLAQSAEVGGAVGRSGVADAAVVRRLGHVRRSGGPHRGVRRALVHVAPSLPARVG